MPLPSIHRTVRSVMVLALSLLSGPSLAADAGSDGRPVGFECPVRVDGTEHLLRVADAEPPATASP